MPLTPSGYLGEVTVIALHSLVKAKAQELSIPIGYQNTFKNRNNATYLEERER